MAEEPQNLSDVLRQLSGALRDGFDRALEDAKKSRPDEVAKLSAQLMDQQSVNRHLATTVAEKDAELEQWRQTGEVLQGRLTDLQAELRAERVRNGIDVAKMDEVIEARDAFEEECRRLRDALGRTPEQLRIAQQTCQDLTKVISSITEQRDNAIEQNRILGRQRDEAQAKAKANHEEILERQRRVQDLDDEVRWRTTERNELHERCEELEQTVATLKTNNAEAARNLSGAYERIEVLERDLGHERTIANRCNDFLREKDIEINELKALVQTLGNDLQARKGGRDGPRIDVFDKLENLRVRVEALERG